MNILNIRNAKYIEPTNTFIDLILETDEGDIPFTYHPDDECTCFQRGQGKAWYIRY
jgi:hypothetical protein